MTRLLIVLQFQGFLTVFAFHMNNDPLIPVQWEQDRQEKSSRPTV